MRVSIITVTYNSSSTLERTIQSVLSQTYEDIEYWIIDGASKDNTLAIIETYSSKFKGRLHWISEPDNGIYDAMNKGIKHCTGDVIGLLNSDDWLNSNTIIEHVVEAFSDETDAVYGDINTYHETKSGEEIYYHISSRFFIPLLAHFGIAPPHPSFYVRKQLYENYGLYDTQYKIAADFELMSRLCWKFGIKTKYVHMDFVTMQDGGASTKNQQAYNDGIKEIYRACKNLGISTTKTMLKIRKILLLLAHCFK